MKTKFDELSFRIETTDKKAEAMLFVSTFLGRFYL